MGACIDNSKIVVPPKPAEPAKSNLRRSKLRHSQIPTYPSIEDVLRGEEVAHLRHLRRQESV